MQQNMKSNIHFLSHEKMFSFKQDFFCQVNEKKKDVFNQRWKKMKPHSHSLSLRVLSVNDASTLLPVDQ